MCALPHFLGRTPVHSERRTSSRRGASFRGFLWTEVEGPAQFRLRGRHPRASLAGRRPRASARRAGIGRIASVVRMRRGLHRLRAELETAGRLPVFRVTIAGEGRLGGRRADALFPSTPRRLHRFLVGSLVPRAAQARLAPRPRGSRAGPLAGLGLVRAHAVCRLGARGVGASSVRGVGIGCASLWLRPMPGHRAIGAASSASTGVSITSTWSSGCRPSCRPSRGPAKKHTPAERPYFGDPTTYLRFAREMEGFYDAHVREPLFVAATKGALVLTGGSDIGISLTSAAFSTMLVGATFLLGARAFGPGVGRSRLRSWPSSTTSSGSAPRAGGTTPSPSRGGVVRGRAARPPRPSVFWTRARPRCHKGARPP